MQAERTTSDSVEFFNVYEWLDNTIASSSNLINDGKPFSAGGAASFQEGYTFFINWSSQNTEEDRTTEYPVYFHFFTVILRQNLGIDPKSTLRELCQIEARIISAVTSIYNSAPKRMTHLITERPVVGNYQEIHIRLRAKSDWQTDGLEQHEGRG